MTRKMKDSGIEWIGMIPEGWDVRKIKTLAILRTGTTPSTNKAEYFDGDIQWFTPGDFGDCLCLYSSERTLSREAVVDDIITLLPSESILVVAIGATVGKIGYLKTDGYCNQQVTAIILNESERSKYYAYWFMVCAPTIKSTANYTTLPIINNSHLNETLCPYVKNTNYQIRIADYLDTKCAEIDALIAAKEKNNALLKEYRQSIIFEAVTKGLDPNAPMKDSGIEWIGMIPEGWGLERLKYRAALNPNIDLPSLSDDSDVTFIPMDHLKKGYHLRSITSYEKVKKGYVIFENNDILMAKVTPCLENGNLAIASQLINGIGFGSTEINVIRCKCIKNKYLYYLLQCDGYINKATYEMYGVAGLKRLDPSFIPNSLIPIPPQAEQQRIVFYLDAKCAEIDALIAANDKTISQLREYRQSIIFEAVTGKVEV